MEFLRNISTQLPHLWVYNPYLKRVDLWVDLRAQQLLGFLAPRALVLKPNKQIIEPENASGKKHIDSN